MTNSIADLVARIKNGYLAKKDRIVVQFSKMNLEVLKVLKKEGYIKDYDLNDSDAKKSIITTLLYNKTTPVLIEINTVSTPGKRVYRKSKYLKPVLGGLGRAILSTPKGIMTDRDAKKNGLGGEVLFNIW